MADLVLYKRVLLKVSGEALLGGQENALDSTRLSAIAEQIAQAHKAGYELGVVIGGGNICRGGVFAAHAGERAQADQMGMLATTINALALRHALVNAAVPCVVLSALFMPNICELFSQNKALEALTAGKVVIFAGGTGNPFFTTDSAAALRAAEIKADVILKATQVDGVYSADPKKDSSAVRFDRLNYQEVLVRGLAVMDMAAIAIAQENKIPVLVYSLHSSGALLKVLRGEGVFTLITTRKI